MIATDNSGEPVRRVTYEDPETKDVYVYYTNVPVRIRPGVVAYLYKRRWGIEKVFNTFKHKFFETRAWAAAEIAKSVQAIFLCMAHNLMTIFNKTLVDECAKECEVDMNRTHRKRKKKRVDDSEKRCKENSRLPSSLILKVGRLAELPVVLIRWLRAHLYLSGQWQAARSALLASCARFLG